MCSTLLFNKTYQSNINDTAVYMYRLEIRHVESVVYLRLEPALRSSGPHSEDQRVQKPPGKCSTYGVDSSSVK